MVPGLTEEAISDAVLDVLWQQVCALLGNTDATSFAPYAPDATPPVLERKVLLYYALCHFATLATGRSAGPRRKRIRRLRLDELRPNQERLADGAVVDADSCGATYWMMTMKYRRGGRLYFSSHYHPWG